MQSEFRIINAKWLKGQKQQQYNMKNCGSIFYQISRLGNPWDIQFHFSSVLY